MQKKSVSVIIPVYNLLNHFESCIRALKYQTIPPDEVIIIDDATDQYNVAKVVRNLFPTAFVIRYETPKFYRKAQCVNAGASIATGDILVVLDQDIICGPAYLEDTIKYHTLYGTLVLYPRIYRHPYFPNVSVSTLSKVVFATNPTGTFSILKDNYWDVGGLNNSYIGHSRDDIEFSSMCVAHGLKVAVPTEIVFHLEHEDHDRTTMGSKKDRILKKSLEQYYRWKS